MSQSLDEDEDAIRARFAFTKEEEKASYARSKQVIAAEKSKLSSAYGREFESLEEPRGSGQFVWRIRMRCRDTPGSTLITIHGMGKRCEHPFTVPVITIANRELTGYVRLALAIEASAAYVAGAGVSSF